MWHPPSLGKQLKTLPSAFVEGVTDEKAWEERFSTIMFGLFYPAVLGTLFVELADALTSDSPLGSFSGTKAWFVLLILGHFLIDHLITARIPGYTLFKFLIDTAILFCLAGSFYSINLGVKEDVNVELVAGFIAAIYVLFIVWECLTPPLRAIRSTLVLYEVLFAFSLSLVVALRLGEQTLLLVLGLSAVCFFAISVAKAPLVRRFDPDWDE